MQYFYVFVLQNYDVLFPFRVIGYLTKNSNQLKEDLTNWSHDLKTVDVLFIGSVLQHLLTYIILKTKLIQYIYK